MGFRNCKERPSGGLERKGIRVPQWCLGTGVPLNRESVARVTLCRHQRAMDGSAETGCRPCTNAKNQAHELDDERPPPAQAGLSPALARECVLGVYQSVPDATKCCLPRRKNLIG